MDQTVPTAATRFACEAGIQSCLPILDGYRKDRAQLLCGAVSLLIALQQQRPWAEEQGLLGTWKETWNTVHSFLDDMGLPVWERERL